MRTRLLLSTIVVAGAVLCAGSAYATGVSPANATPVQREQAQDHFLKGKDAYEKKDFATALTEFRASLDIVASPNARLYVARALRDSGKLVEAYGEYGRTAAEAKEYASADPRYGQAAQAATDEQTALAPKLGFVKLTIHNGNDSTKVTVSGTPLERPSWADPVPVNPGDVDVQVTTTGAAPVDKKVTVAAGATVPLDLDAGAPAVVAPPPPPPPDTGSHHGPGWMLPVAIAGGGVGVAGMIMFAAAGIASNGTYSDLQKQCGNSPCPPSLSDEISRGKTEQALANTGLVVGLIGLAVGATFFTLWLLPHKHAGATSASLVVGPGSVGLAGTF
jgi:hypothetical protein